MQTAKVLNFPLATTRHYIDRQVRDYAQGQIGRDTMMRRVGGLLRTYKIKRLPIDNYEVALIDEYEGLPIVHIRSRLPLSDACPACHSNEWWYIVTERELIGSYDVVTAWCMDCSCFYRRKGYKAEQDTN